MQQEVRLVMKLIPFDYMCIVLISVNLIVCGCGTSLSQDSLRINIIAMHSIDDSSHLAYNENQIWNRDGTDYVSFNTNDVQTDMLQFGSKSIIVRQHRNKIIVADAYTHSNYVDHVSGWSKRLQCAAVVPVCGTNFLFVIKGHRTYHNYSRIHVFNDDLICCCEKEISGRSWRIMDISCEGDHTSIFLKNGENDECVKIIIDHQKKSEKNLL